MVRVSIIRLLWILRGFSMMSNDQDDIKQQQFEQYKRVAEAMAQDLREYADAAQDAGESILVTESLLDEFDVVSNFVNGFGG